MLARHFFRYRVERDGDGHVDFGAWSRGTCVTYRGTELGLPALGGRTRPGVDSTENPRRWTVTAARMDTVATICTARRPSPGRPSQAAWHRQSTGSPGRRLHERDAALAEIRSVLGGAYDHPWVPIVIEGFTGTGTTALLNASLETGRELGLRIGRARCDPSESSAPFAVVRQLFSSMRHQLAFPTNRWTTAPILADACFAAAGPRTTTRSMCTKA